MGGGNYICCIICYKTFFKSLNIKQKFSDFVIYFPVVHFREIFLVYVNITHQFVIPNYIYLFKLFI